MKPDCKAAHSAGEAPIRLIHCFCYFFLVLSLPWSIWGTSRWLGLLLHFQVASGGAWMIERVFRRQRILRRTA